MRLGASAMLGRHELCVALACVGPADTIERQQDRLEIGENERPRNHRLAHRHLSIGRLQSNSVLLMLCCLQLALLLLSDQILPFVGIGGPCIAEFARRAFQGDQAQRLQALDPAPRHPIAAPFRRGMIRIKQIEI